MKEKELIRLAEQAKSERLCALFRLLRRRGTAVCGRNGGDRVQCRECILFRDLLCRARGAFCGGSCGKAAVCGDCGHGRALRRGG